MSLRLPLQVLRQSSRPLVTARQFSTARCMLQIKKGELDVTSSEEGNGGDIVSGAPRDLTERVVRIYQQSKPATQSGSHGTVAWRLDWDTVSRANRWENDLMGWPSSGDYMQATQMKFRTKEDAIQFARNQAWDYYVQEPNKRDFRVKQYATNFQHSPTKLKHIRTK